MSAKGEKSMRKVERVDRVFKQKGGKSTPCWHLSIAYSMPLSSFETPCQHLFDPGSTVGGTVVGQYLIEQKKD